MTIRLNRDQDPAERSTYVVVARFLDADGAEVVPSSAVWTLTDTAGTIINGRSQVPFLPLAATVQAVLSNSDLALSGDSDSGQRLITIEAIYSSDLGGNLPIKEAAIFGVKSLIAVS